MLFARLIAGLIGLAAGFTFVSYLPYLPEIFGPNADPLLILLMAVTGCVAVLGLWFALFAGIPAERARMAATLRAGLGLGLVGFLAGFFGPMFFTPDANQGPLLGIFITGPGGFVLGCIVGFLWSRLVSV